MFIGNIQIDVYWEYLRKEVVHRVAIECKNYSKPVPKEKVCAFQGVLSDLDGVEGVMVSKKGFQKGAKQYAAEYGISLKELREPEKGESVIGEIEMVYHIEKLSTLYKVDENWGVERKIDFTGYKQRLDIFYHKWVNSTHIPLQLADEVVRNAKGDCILSLSTIRSQILKHPTEDFPYVLPFEDAYVNTTYWGLVKILEVKFTFNNDVQQKFIAIDAEGFVKAILKDALIDKTDIMVLSK